MAQPVSADGCLTFNAGDATGGDFATAGDGGFGRIFFVVVVTATAFFRNEALDLVESLVSFLSKSGSTPLAILLLISTTQSGMLLGVESSSSASNGLGRLLIGS